MDILIKYFSRNYDLLVNRSQNLTHCKIKLYLILRWKPDPAGRGSSYCNSKNEFCKVSNIICCLRKKTEVKRFFLKVWHRQEIKNRFILYEPSLRLRFWSPIFISSCSQLSKQSKSYLNFAIRRRRADDIEVSKTQLPKMPKYDHAQPILSSYYLFTLKYLLTYVTFFTFM